MAISCAICETIRTRCHMVVARSTPLTVRLCPVHRVLDVKIAPNVPLAGLLGRDTMPRARMTSKNTRMPCRSCVSTGRFRKTRGRTVRLSFKYLWGI